MSRFKATGSVLVFTLILTAVMTACAPAATPAPEAPTQPSAAVEPTAAPAAAGSDRYGGILRHAIPPPANLDPAFLGSISDDEIGRTWHDFLVFIGEDNKPDLNRSLAEKWEVTADGLQWTFTLRQGVVFHNGKEMTSADVKFSFDRLRDPELGSPSVSLYSAVTAIEAPDTYTVIFKLSSPNPDFLNDLGDLHGLVVDANATDLKTDLNGTGAFRVKEYIPEDRIVFERNSDYWQHDEFGNQLPYLDGMEFLFISDDTARVHALLSGQVDWLIYLPPEYVKEVEDNPDTVVYRQTSNTIWLIHMRSDRKPAGDNLVRQAIRYATDREALLTATYQGLGTIANDTPIGPTYGDFYLDVPPPARDVAKAKDLLAQAGYPSGLTIDVTCQDRAPVPAMCTVWKEQLAEAGITANIQVVPTDIYYGAQNLWMEADFAITDWGSRSSPQPYLDLAFECGAVWNESHFCDAELDVLAKQAKTEMDHAKRVEAYHKIQTIFMERGPLILPFFVDNLYGANAKLKGVVPPMAFGTGTDLKRVYFEK